MRLADSALSEKVDEGYLANFDIMSTEIPDFLSSPKHSASGTNFFYLESLPTPFLTPSNKDCELFIMRSTLVCLLLTALYNVAVTTPVAEPKGVPVEEVVARAVNMPYPPIPKSYKLCCTRLCVDQSDKSCSVSSHGLCLW